MRHGLSEQERQKVLRLLETLRAAGPAPDFSVEAAVARRVRALPAPRFWMPVVSLRAFGWCAAAALAALVVGAVGLISASSPGWLSSPRSALSGLASTLATIGLAGWDVARALARGALEMAGRFSDAASYLDGSLALAAQAALFVCVGMLILTVLFVSHETRGRRLTG